MFGFDVGNVNLFSNNGENSIKHQLRRLQFRMWGRGEGSFIGSLTHSLGLFFNKYFSAPQNNAFDYVYQPRNSSYQRINCQMILYLYATLIVKDTRKLINM